MTHKAIGRATLISTLLAGCGVDLAVGDDLQIECRSRAQCPRGFECSAQLGRCVRAGRDMTPPEILSLTVEIDGQEELIAKTAAPGREVRFRLVASEPLGASPHVALVWAAAPDVPPVSASEVEADAERRSFVFAHQVSAAAAEGFVSVSARVVDTAGLPGTLELPRAFSVDRTPPRLAARTASLVLTAGDDNPHAGRGAVDAATGGTSLDVYFALSEPLGGAGTPQVTAVQETDETGGAPVQPETIALTQAGDPVGTFWTFSTILPPAPVPGAYRIEVEATDVAGNETEPPETAEELHVVIDTRAPQAPDVEQEGRIVYLRAPWGGRDVQAGAEPFALTGGAGAIEAHAWAIALRGCGPVATHEIGRARADGDGGFGPLGLGGADRAEVFLVAADAAGNFGDCVLVRDVTWTATLTADGPHDVSARTAIGAALATGRGMSVIEVAPLAVEDGAVATTRGAVVGWDELVAAPAPPIAVGAPMLAYDHHRDRVVLFGGYDALGYTDTTWEWDGQYWQRVCGASTPCLAPPFRSGAAMAYDRRRGRVVLFGGDGGNPTGDFLGDTWEWDGHLWERVCAAGAACAAGLGGRYRATMTYDPQRGRVVLFGGCSALSLGACSALSDEVWEWDGGRWSRLCGGDSGCAGPTARFDHAWAFDELRGVAVLHGGCTAVPGPPCTAYSDELWEWDGASWTPRCDGAPAGDSCASRPSARIRQVAVYDQLRGETVVIGGVASGNVTVDETWVWSGDAWAHVCGGALPGCATLPEIRSAAAAYVASGATVFLYGGLAPSALSDQSWEWDGASWVQRGGGSFTPALPAARFRHAMVHDAARGHTLLFGGCVNNSAHTCTGRAQDLWQHDGRQWHQRCDGVPAGDTCAVQPSAREGHAMVFDQARQVSLLFGGYDGAANGETWEWDGGAWARRCDGSPAGDTCAAQPSARQRHGLAYDEVRDVAVLFGGHDGAADGETWEWNGTTWTQRCDGSPAGDVCSTPPPARHSHALVYDAVRERVLAFGGCTGTLDWWCSGGALSDQLWEWDPQANDWALLCGAGTDCSGPLPTLGHAMVFDRERGVAVVYGGVVDWDGAGTAMPRITFDSWEWNGSGWTQACGHGQACAGPSARFYPAAAFGAGEGLLVGGLGATWTRMADVWRWQGGGGDRPAHLAQVRLASAFAGQAHAPWPALGDCLFAPELCPLRALQVSWTGAGHGAAAHDLETPVYGTALWGWLDGGWQPLGDGPPAVDLELAPLAVELASPADAAALAGLCFGDDLIVNLALVPAGVNGQTDGLAEVHSDYLEVVVRYRLAAP